MSGVAGVTRVAAPPGARPPALLVLEDGTTFSGTAYGAPGEAFGEAVFSTSMTGYQETLTDPSYRGQIITMTAPHIGNTGINDEDHESRRIWAAGLVLREPSPVSSSWRAARSLDDELRAQGVTAIAISGTRALTLRLRERGVMRAAIICLGSQLLGRVLGLGTYKLRFGHRGGNQPVKDLRTGRVQITSHNHGFAVAVPTVLARGGTLLAGGSLLRGHPGPRWPPAPGGPESPVGGVRFSTDFGAAEVTHVNLNDGVVEGLRLLDAPAFAVQFHPEAAPGPHDAAGLFAEFCELMEQR